VCTRQQEVSKWAQAERIRPGSIIELQTLARTIHGEEEPAQRETLATGGFLAH
jgi:hypothetical protein